jgi:hypothetical protein
MINVIFHNMAEEAILIGNAREYLKNALSAEKNSEYNTSRLTKEISSVLKEDVKKLSGILGIKL